MKNVNKIVNIALIFMVLGLLLDTPLYSIDLSKTTYLRPPLKYAVWTTKNIDRTENVAQFPLYGSIGRPLAENRITIAFGHIINGEIMIYKDNIGVLLVGDHRAGKSSLLFTALKTSKDWQVVAPSMSTISLAKDNNSGKITLIGQALKGTAPLLPSRFHGEKKITMVYPEGVFIHYIVAFDNRSLNGLKQISSDFSFEDAEVEIMHLNKWLKATVGFQNLLGIITEHMQRIEIEALGGINNRLPNIYPRTCP